MTSAAGVFFLQPHGEDFACRARADTLTHEHGPRHAFALTPPHAFLHYFVHADENRHATRVNTSLRSTVHSEGNEGINVDLSAQDTHYQRHQLCHSFEYTYPSIVQCRRTTNMYKGSISHRAEEDILEAERPTCAMMKNLYTDDYVPMGEGKSIHLIDRKERKQAETDVFITTMQPESHAYSAILEACSLAATISEGRLTHAEIIAHGYAGQTHVCNVLISMYSRCGSLMDSCLVFQRLPEVDVVTWNSLVTSHAKSGDSMEVFRIYNYMQSCGIEPDVLTYECALKACYGIAHLEQGRAIHCEVLERGVILVGSSTRVGNSLVIMYSNCGCLEGARVVFESLPERDVVTWNALIDGNSKFGFVEAALDVYHDMCRQRVQPTLVTFVCTLKACSIMRNIEQGQKIHTRIVVSGVTLDPIIENALLDLYCKCGNFEDARFLFDGLSKKTVITWNTLITGYSLHQSGHLAIDLFRQMQIEGPQPDTVTYVCILKACSSLLDLERGRELHSQLVKSGMDMDTFIGNILITMYGHCGSTEDARSVFDLTPVRDVVTWSALMTGYTHDGQGKEVLEMFGQMRSKDLELDEAAFVCVLKACAHTAALEQGMEFHAYATEKGCEFKVPISSTLITMYGLCGNLDMALLVFNRLAEKSVVSFNAMLAVLGEHGESRLSIQLYQSMAHAGIKPNNITFTCLLSACRSSGLVEEGSHFFTLMQRDNGIFPETEHYGCMVDILGKTGHGDAAEDLIETISAACNIVCWTSLLSSCIGCSDLPLGKRCFDHAVYIDPTNTSVYVLMSKLYKGAGLLKNAMEVESLRKHRNKWKIPGKAYIEVSKKIHEFVVGDKTHPQYKEINLKVKELGKRIAEKTFSPPQNNVSNFLQDSDEKLCGHSERLAIAFGLLNTNAGTTIRVAKNIRMCAECHTTAKLTSFIEYREIVVSDSYCVHNFREGACSCKE